MSGRFSGENAAGCNSKSSLRTDVHSKSGSEDWFSQFLETALFNLKSLQFKLDDTITCLISVYHPPNNNGDLIPPIIPNLTLVIPDSLFNLGFTVILTDHWNFGNFEVSNRIFPAILSNKKNKASVCSTISNAENVSISNPRIYSTHSDDNDAH
jgi:hypothetical protein